MAYFVGLGPSSVTRLMSVHPLSQLSQNNPSEMIYFLPVFDVFAMKIISYSALKVSVVKASVDIPTTGARTSTASSYILSN